MKKTNYYYTIITLLFILFSGYFIYKTSFVIDGVRYFSLFDDAMVSMNYARNLAHGNGLVMNPGEHVEGITNPLWTLWMSLIHMFPVSQPKISLLIQITGVLLLLFNLHFVRKTSQILDTDNSLAPILSVFLTAFYLPLVNWTLQGMETGLQTLIISAAVFRAIAGYKNGKVNPDVYLILGIGTLVRIDTVVILLFMMAIMTFLDRNNIFRHVLWSFLVFIIFVGGQTVFRMAYYGDIFPNTYYLKMTGYPILLRLSRGFLVWCSFISDLNILLVLFAGFLLAATAKKETLIPIAVISAQMLYSIYVGGDAWEGFGGSNRYITSVMPLFFILLVFAFSKAGNFVQFVKLPHTSINGKILSFVTGNILIILVLFAFFQFNSPAGPLNLKNMLLLDAPPHVENNKTMVERALLIKKITDPEALIAVSWAGAIPYFSERKTADILGKTDKTIAKMPMRTSSGPDRFRFFLPGHLKYDYSYTVGKLQPDAVLQFWGELSEADPYVADKYVKLVVKDKIFYLKNGSNHILWNIFSKQGNQ